MSRSIVLSAVLLIPLAGIGSVVGLWSQALPQTAGVVSSIRIDPNEMQSKIDVRSLPEQKIADYI